MNKCCLLTMYILLLLQPLNIFSQRVIYYTPVQMPPPYQVGFYGLMEPAAVAADMADLLSAATGTKYVSSPYINRSKEGIYLLLDSNLALSSNESAIISSDGSTNLVIRAKYITGISYAVYTYLDKLGFRFYLPGKNWIITPKLTGIYLQVFDKVEWKPYFKNRIMSISGGMPSIKGLDDQNNNSMEWNIWYRRNRMGSEFLGIGGHIGEEFNMENRQAIEKDSLILAPVQGRRQYNTFGKLDPTYPKAVKMFIDWAVEKYRLENIQTPYFLPWHKYQSVDPGDGLDYCHTAACELKFKTVSDQAFFIANEAAKAIRVKYPTAGVSLYAYTERADTPAFRLEPNVHVGIVSTAFQSVDLPAGLVKRWVSKTPHVTLYDYINIGVWSHENPYFNLDSYFKYLQWAKKFNIDGFTFEAAPAKFSAGVPQYFILRYLSDPYNNVQQEFDRFCSLSFGAASGAIEPMLKEWYFSEVHFGTESFEDFEIGRFVKQMVAADNTVSNDAIKKRLEDLKAYIVFLSKKYDISSNLQISAQNLKDNTVKMRLTSDLLNYTWQLYKKNIFHNTQFNDVMKEALRTDAVAYNKWDYNKSDFSQFGTPDPDLVQKEFAKVKRNFLPRALPEYTIDDAFLERTSKLSADSVLIQMVDEQAVSSYIYTIDIYCPLAGKLIIHYKAGNSKITKLIANQKGFAAVLSDDYRYIDDQPIPLKSSMGTLTFFIPAKGHYQLSLGQQNSTPITFLIKPGANLLYINKASIPSNFVLLRDDKQLSPQSYLAFYVPSVDSISYRYTYPDCVNTISLYNNTGQEVKANFSGVPSNIVYQTTTTDRNNFMYYSNSLFRWPPLIKNVPPYYFFLRFPVKK